MQRKRNYVKVILTQLIAQLFTIIIVHNIAYLHVMETYLVEYVYNEV